MEEVIHGEWRKCDRCRTDHKEVWVCTVDADEVDIIAKLGGKRMWRVGSKCGPTLEMVSAASWAPQTKDLQRVVRLAVDATRVLEKAKAFGIDHLFLPWVVERLEFLKSGQLSRHLQGVLRSHVNAVADSVERATAKTLQQ